MIPPRSLTRLVLRPPRLWQKLRAPVVIEGQVLDRQVQWLLALQRLLRAPGLHDVTVERSRKNFRLTCPLLAPRPGPFEDWSFSAPGGLLKVRVHRPSGVERLPALIYFHGGGFVVGDLDSHHGVCTALAQGAGCVVVAVDYRLAPEHPYPAAVEDAWAALQWVLERHRDLGIDPRRVAVGGDSAGGNLSAVIARRARDAGLEAPCLQLLIYPATDMSREAQSIRTFGQGFLLTQDDMDWFYGRYATPAQRREPDASPLLAEDLSGVAPACILTAGFDPLRDEGGEYARRLREAGVPTEFVCFEGLIHGFMNLAGVIPKAREAFDHAVGSVRQAFAGSCQRDS